jgi:aminopeptidase N
MKKSLFIIIFLFPLFSLSQIQNPDAYKAEFNSRNKSDINLYYNPLLNNYDLHFVHLDLEITDESTYIKGNVSLHATATKSLDTLLFQLSDYLTVDSVFINDIKVSTTHNNDYLRYIFSPALPENSEIVTKIYYQGTSVGAGVSNRTNTDWNKKVTWTLSESFHAYEWWPCKQVLSDKIDSTYIFLTCDDDLKAGSNGLLINEVNLPNNKKQFEWKTYYPINYYLISFSVSEYQDYSIYAYPEGSGPVLIQNYIYNSTGCLDYYKNNLDRTADLIELYSDKFGLYPFRNEKYGHCLAELGGGMEHQTMSTMINFNFYLVAHELGHMWFGDYVTCASWQDIWINEGFASYTEYVAKENLESLSSAKNWMIDAYNYALNEPHGSVYIPFEHAAYESRIFNYALSYKKGAALVHMIRNEINNDELFFSALKNYLSEYANGVATGDDFKNSIATFTGINFDAFFDQWYYGKGFPSFKAGYTQENDTLKLSVHQTTSSSETPLFQMYVDYKISFYEGDTTIRLYQSKNNEFYKIPFSKKITSIELDPENNILKKMGTVDSVRLPANNSSLFEVFPNPARNRIRLRFNLNLHNKRKDIQIYSANGELVKQIKTKENFISIGISDLSNGLYFVKANSLGKSYSYKIIKQ